MTETIAVCNKGVWEITGPAHILMKLKAVFPKIKKSEYGTVHLKDSIDVSKDLLWFSERYPVTFDNRSHAEKQAEIYDQKVASINRVLDPNFKPEPCQMAIPLRHYQEVAVAHALTQHRILLADDIGLGKTVTALGVFSRVSPAVVVCDTHLTRQWKRECEAFLPNAKPHIATKGQPYALPEGTDILILTYTKLAGWADVLIEGYWPLLIFDEVQSLRHSGTGKYSAATAMAEKAEYVVGLSATPIHNYGNEMFNIYEAIRPGTLGTLEEFTREWTSGWQGKQVKDPVALGSFLRAEGAMLRRTKFEVGRELPKVKQSIYPIQSDQRVFDSIAGNAAELARLILSQESSFVEKGRASRELDMRLRQATGISKAPSVAEFVKILAEEVGKVILFGWHRAVFDIWMSSLKELNPVLYSGTESPAQKDAAKKRFVEGDASIFIMSLRSGLGLDGLQKVCSDAVFGELDFSPAVHNQCVGRVNRDGQPNPVNAYFLVSDDGSDPVLAQLLGIKKAQHEGVVDLGESEILDTIPESRIKEMAQSYLGKKS